VPWAWIGEVVGSDELEIVAAGGGSDRVAVRRLAGAWRGEDV
jgi:hypothetical protein